MTIFFISDTHFGHANIIKYSQRPFTSVEEMNEVMVQRWNTVVRPGDHVYHLGDVAFNRPSLQIVRRLVGKKRLILGNHDQERMQDYAAVGFQKIMGARVFGGVLFTHYPVHPMSAGDNGNDLVKIKGNAHGHIHERSAPVGPYVNLSVEWTDYNPVSLEEVQSRLLRAQ
jgi:calcineurin-like phosphoesterase family protein